MHTFESSTGCWFDATGKLLGRGWSGQLDGRNNPTMQNVANVGPIPEGMYTIGKSYHHSKLGPITMDLEPDTSNKMFGRSEFRVHGFGEDIIHASEGCVIQVEMTRKAIDSSSDRRLQVVKSITGGIVPWVS
jgi:hypothetical protein